MTAILRPAARQIERLWLAQHGQCFYCPALIDPTRAARRNDMDAEADRRWRGYTRDHFLPRAHGGPDAEWNLVLACAPCNGAKGDRMPTAVEMVRFVALRETGAFIPAGLASDTAIAAAFRAAFARLALTAPGVRRAA